jgi:hypothetical protein
MTEKEDYYENADPFDWIYSAGVFPDPDGKPEIRSRKFSHSLDYRYFGGAKLYLVSGTTDKEVAEFYKIRYAPSQRLDEFLQEIYLPSWEAFSKEHPDVCEGLIKHWVSQDDDPLYGLNEEFDLDCEYKGMDTYSTWLEKKKLESSLPTNNTIKKKHTHKI